MTILLRRKRHRSQSYENDFDSKIIIIFYIPKKNYDLINDE